MGECIIDIYGRPQPINHEEVSLRNRVGDQTWVIVEKKEEIINSNKLHQIAELLLPYANIHISILFIVVLSFLSFIFVNIISVIITILFIISLIKSINLGLLFGIVNLLYDIYLNILIKKHYLI